MARTGNTIRKWAGSKPMGIAGIKGRKESDASVLGFRVGQKVVMQQTGIVGIVVRETSAKGRVLVRANRKNYACLPSSIKPWQAAQ